MAVQVGSSLAEAAILAAWILTTAGSGLPERIWSLSALPAAPSAFMWAWRSLRAAAPVRPAATARLETSTRARPTKRRAARCSWQDAKLLCTPLREAFRCAGQGGRVKTQMRSVATWQSQHAFEFQSNARRKIEGTLT